MNNNSSTNLSIISILLLAIGCGVNAFIYSSIEPVLVGGIIFLLGVSIIQIPKIGGTFELQSFTLMFSVCWFWAGVAAIYANMLNDPSQNLKDAANFYRLVSSGDASGKNVEEIRYITEGAGVVVVWRSFYNFFAWLGIDKGRYIGITINVFFVSLTSVVGVKIMRLLFGNDRIRIYRFIIIFSFCGIFWLFASIHIRDAAILLSVSLLILFWVRFLTKPSVINLLQLVVVTIISFSLFELLRAEFKFVPLAMILAGMSALVFGKVSQRANRELIYISIAAALVISVFLLIEMHSSVLDALTSGHDFYSGQPGNSLHYSNKSLGARFIVNTPLPIRLTLGSAYLFVYPIPFWGGFQLESVYHLMKSFQAIYMYAIAPLFTLASWRLIHKTRLRTAPILFLFILSIGFILSIAYTSLETRHFGAFLLPILILATLPNITQHAERVAYMRLLKIFLLIMFLVHMIWIVIKFL